MFEKLCYYKYLYLLYKNLTFVINIIYCHIWRYEFMKETAFIHVLCLLISLIILFVLFSIFSALFSIFVLQQNYKENYKEQLSNAIYKARLMSFLLPISFYLYIYIPKNSILYIYILKNSIFSNPSMWITFIWITFISAYVYLYLPKKSSPKFHDFIKDILNFIKLLHKLINNPLSFIFSLFERIEELFERIKRKENVFLEVFASLLFIPLLFSMFIILPFIILLAFYMVS